VGDERGDVEAGRGDQQARQRDQRIDAAWVQADLFGCLAQGGGRRVTISGFTTAAGKRYFAGLVPKRVAALQENNFGAHCGVFEEDKDGDLLVSDTCREWVVGAELLRFGAAQRGDRRNKWGGDVGRGRELCWCREPLVNRVGGRVAHRCLLYRGKDCGLPRSLLPVAAEQRAAFTHGQMVLWGRVGLPLNAFPAGISAATTPGTGRGPNRGIRGGAGCSHW
jgi:hypothetical protein